MPDRLVHLANIHSRREFQLDFVDPGDFNCDLQSAPGWVTLPPYTLAYCADMARERMLFTTHGPIGCREVLAAPFLYLAQFLTARSLITVPFERLDEAGLDASAARPIFVFSPARTGSTLLTRLLVAAGVPCASEPDMLTQMAQADRSVFAGQPPGMREFLAGLCVASLAEQLGAGAVIKLRSQCNMRPMMLVEAAPGSRVVFMLRGLRAWALSRHRVFKEPPDAVALTLRHAFDALDKLLVLEERCTVMWFEDMLANPAAAIRHFAPAVQLDGNALAAVMAADSQEGTMISRAMVAEHGVDADFMPAFQAAWAEARAGAEWSAQTLGYLAEMADK